MESNMLLANLNKILMSFATDNEINIAHDILLRGHKPFDENRINIIKNDTSCYVQASPGSGKTTVLLAKLIILANRMPLPDGKGVCVLTHTNVAIDEIKAKLGQKADILFRYPNFFGTIQTFLHKFVTTAALQYFYGSQISYVDDDIAQTVLLKKYDKLSRENKLKKLVFAHIASKKHIIEIDEINALGGVDALTNANVIRPIGKKIIKYDFQLSKYDLSSIPNNIKQLIRLRRDTILVNQSKEIILSFKADWANRKILTDSNPIGMTTEAGSAYLSIKEEMFSEGVLSFVDAYDLAFRYIRENNLDFSSFSNYRFKYLFIDEVQDCDKKQVELIKSIFADTKVIVQRFGDYCQAIFDGDDNDRVEIEELKGGRVSYIHDSNRFGEKIAKPLRTLCMEDNRSLVGNDSVPSLKPIIITYVDPLAVIPKFVELLNSITITEKGKLTVLEVANKERYEDPLHRINIKACGWVGKKVSNERARSVVSYFPAFERKDLQPKSEGDYFDDFIPKNPNTNVKDFAASLIQGILKFLDVCNIKDGNRRYTRKSLLQVLTSCHLKDVFLNKIMCWSMDLVKSKTPNDITTVKNQIYVFIKNSIMPIFEKNVVEDAKSFFNTFGEDNKDVEIIKHGNVFHGEGIDIEVATVHSVKGETHAATLYLETSYFGKHESEYIREQFKGIPYTGTDKRVLQCLRIIYVGASRPRYLLCMAMQKDRFDSIDCPAMRDIWEVVEA